MIFSLEELNEDNVWRDDCSDGTLPVKSSFGRLGALRRHLVASMLWAPVLSLMLPQAAQGESLAEAMRKAYANNPNLREQRLRQKSVNEDYVQTRAQYGPSVSLSAAGNYDFLRGRTTLRLLDQRTASATLNQPLYSGGRLRGALDSQLANVRRSQESLRQIEADTVQAVIQVYAGVLRDHQRLVVGQENIKVLQEQLREVTARRKVEDATLTDLAQADSRLAQAESQLASLQAQYDISRGQYLEVVGELPVDLEPLPELDGLPTSFDEALKLAETGNFTLNAARYAERASAARLASRKGEQRPTLSFVTQVGALENETASSLRATQTQVYAGLTLSQSLFAGGAVRSRIRQARDLNEADQVAIDGARRSALQDVVVAWSQLAAARLSLTASLRQVSAAQVAFKGAQKERQYGFRTVIEVLNAEQELQSAQLNLLQTRFNEYVARASLLSAMGQLNAQTVDPTIEPYDAEGEFDRVRNIGATPFEPIARTIDRIGSANPRPKTSAALTGDGIPAPGEVRALPPALDPQAIDEALTPISAHLVVAPSPSAPAPAPPAAAPAVPRP